MKTSKAKAAPVVEVEKRGSVAGAYAAQALKDSARHRLESAAPDLLTAAKAAKEYLEPDLVEPGRTVFWNLVDAIAKAEGRL